MTDADKRAFASLLSAVLDLYERKLTPSQAAIWFGALSDLSLAEVRAALDAHVRDPERGQYAPKPADVIRHARPAPAATAAAAWDMLVEAIRRHGHWSDVVFPDRRIHAVVADMGGWLRVCRWSEDELPYRERDFAARYLACREAREYPPVLRGMGTDGSAPALVGDSRACRAVAGDALLRLEGGHG